MDPGEAIVRWTVRLSLLLGAAALAVLWSPDPPGKSRQVAPERLPRTVWARRLWTAGFGLFAAHVAAAFHVYHHWSHAHAYAETARQTREVIGLDWGGGLYVNYFFLLLWLADLAWWWLAPRTHATRFRWVRGLWYAFFLFIAFNGTVIFKSGATRWVGVAVFAALAASAARTWKRKNDQFPMTNDQ